MHGTDKAEACPEGESPLPAIRAYRDAHARELVEELCAFVRIPNDVSDRAAIASNAEALRAMLERRGFRTRLLPTADGRPLVYGELLAPRADTTLLIYSHYDGVPAGPGWHSAPYEPVLRRDHPAGPEGSWDTIPLPADGRFDGHWRLYGRSVADSKNAIVALLAALDALRASGGTPGASVKVILDGEEERESPGLAASVAAHRDLLAADLLISASGEVHQSGLPTVAFGVRGALMFELTLHTATTDLHSGHFGTFAPSAPARLAALLASLWDESGRPTIPGFAEDVAPLGAGERAALRAVPAIEREVAGRFGIAAPAGGGASLQELINRPTLNVRGLRAGFVGEEARNIVPATATASFDVRLVKGMLPDRTFARIRDHLERRGWPVLDRPPTREELLARGPIVEATMGPSFPASRTPLDAPIARSLLRAVERAVAGPLVVEPTEGGSVPLHLFERLGIPIVTLPTSNYDCNQHTADENLRLDHFFRAIDIFASVLRWQ